MSIDPSIKFLGQAVDASNYTSGILPVPCRRLHCNVSNTYRLWFEAGSYHDMYLYKGLEYEYRCVRVSDTSSAVLAAGQVKIIF